MRVVVLGGSGRVGASSARALKQKNPSLDITLAGRRETAADEVRRATPELESARFARCDIDDVASVARVLDDADLVIHSAGPFQRRNTCAPLEAAIATQTPYLDVCDDTAYAMRCKQMSGQAEQAGVPAVTSAGIYPGVSNVMAAEMVAEASASGSEVDKVVYSYFTAGTGGVGPTILATTFLLLGEEVVLYEEGKRVLKKPFTQRRVLNFGERVGIREVFLVNLPEVTTTHTVLGVPNVEARFGTDPGIWNGVMGLMAKYLPPSLLTSPGAAKALASLSLPAVKLTDLLSGSAVAMRVDVKKADGQTLSGLYSHRYTAKAVGNSVAAFAENMLAGGTRPGVWYPEEEGAVAPERRVEVLQRAAEKCRVFKLGQAAWQIESKPKQVGFGVYFD